MQRRTLAPLFARRSVASFTRAMLEAADQLSARWRLLAPRQAIDVAGEVTRLTLNVLALTIFSDGIGGNYDEFRSAMTAYFDALGRIDALDLLGVPAFVPRLGRRSLRHAMVYFEKTIDEIIEVRRRRIASSDVSQDLLTLLLRALDPSTGRPMSIAEVRSNILTFLSAGHETTANTLAWSVFLLSQSPFWYARVRKEADREMSGDIDRLLDRLVVTRSVVEEALRLYPPIAALSRTSEQGRCHRRSLHQASRADCDRTLCLASAPSPLGSSRCLRSHEVPCAGEGKYSPLCVFAVRRGPADLHRLFLRAAGSNNRARSPRPSFRHAPSARGECVAISKDHVATGPWLAYADNAARGAP